MSLAILALGLGLVMKYSQDLQPTFQTESNDTPKIELVVERDTLNNQHLFIGDPN